MYNGIGLTTARGSGTSGYVQKNLAFVKPTKKPMQFEKQFKDMMDNPIAPPRKANKEIIEHERLHKIEAQLFVVREKLESEGLTEDAILEKLREARKFIEEKLKEENVIDKKESHMAALAKEKQLEKVKNALNIKGDFKPGSAFDFETQQKKQQDRVAEQEEKRKERKMQKKEREKEKLAQEEAKKVAAIEPPPKEEVEKKPEISKETEKEEGEVKNDKNEPLPVQEKKHEHSKHEHKSHKKHRNKSRSRSRSGSSSSRKRSRSKGKDKDKKKEKRKRRSRSKSGSSHKRKRSNS